MLKFIFQPLSEKFDRSQFDCGDEILNSFLRTYSRQGQNKGFNRTYVAIIETDPGLEIKGYYSISMGQVDLRSLPEQTFIKLPKHPVPVGRIGRLAVSKFIQGRGLGKELLVDALIRIKAASKIIGAHAVVVDAKDLSSKTFYEHYGFVSFVSRPLSLYLPITSVPDLNA